MLRKRKMSEDGLRYITRPKKRYRPKCKTDQTVCYLTIKEVGEITGRSQTIIWKDIENGHLKALKGSTCTKTGSYTVAYAIHPKDAEEYKSIVKGKTRVQWKKLDAKRS